MSLHFDDVGSGQAVVLIHGLGASSSFWGTTVERVVGARRVVVVDLPGFGQSPNFTGGPEVSDYSDAIAELLQNLGLDRCDVVGHSFGGLVAQRFAIDHRNLVRNLVLVSPGDLDVKAVRKALMAGAFQFAAWTIRHGTRRRAILTSAWPRKVVTALGAVSGMPTDLLAELIFNGLASSGVSTAIQASMSDRTFTESHRIQVPTVIVSGTSDRLVTESNARAMASRIPGAVLHIWDGAGHCPMFDRPAEFATLIMTLGDTHLDPTKKPPPDRPTAHG